MVEQQETQACIRCELEKPIGEYRLVRAKRGGRDTRRYALCSACESKWSSCIVCGKVKAASHFGVNRKRFNGIAERCKDCCKLWARDFRQRHRAKTSAYDAEPERIRYKRQFHYKKKYGITIEQFDAILLQQGGRCAICRQFPGGVGVNGTLCVDHCHKTGQVRALLCDWCNKALGMARESPELLDAMACYLRAHASKQLIIGAMANASVKQGQEDSQEHEEDLFRATWQGRAGLLRQC